MEFSIQPISKSGRPFLAIDFTAPVSAVGPIAVGSTSTVAIDPLPPMVTVGYSATITQFRAFHLSLFELTSCAMRSTPTGGRQNMKVQHRFFQMLAQLGRKWH